MTYALTNQPFTSTRNPPRPQADREVNVQAMHERIARRFPKVLAKLAE